MKLGNSRKKVFIAFGIFLISIMLMRLAFLSIAHAVSVWLIILATIMMLTAIVVFARNFRE